MENSLSLLSFILDEEQNIESAFFQQSEYNILEITVRDILLLISQNQVFPGNSNTKNQL